MEKNAHFCFYGSLTDFLQAPGQEKIRIAYRFKDKPALKDAIEAIGIPHPEVAAMLVNGTAAGFFDPLHPLDQVEVFPAGHLPAVPHDYALRNPNPEPEKFVLDVHLGKLARFLRMLGFDTLYENHYADKNITEIAEKERRIVLSRDVGLLKQKIVQWGYWLRSQQAEEQLAEVVRYFRLRAQFNPFTRCMACNGIIEETSKNSVWDQLPLKTRRYYNEFYQCTSCGRIYWKGSHYERMQAFIRSIDLNMGYHPLD